MQTLGITARMVKPPRQSRLLDCLVEIASAPITAPTDPKATDTQFHLTERPDARNIRILVAEDNLVNQRLALRQLRKLGYSADAVASGPEVWEALHRVPYDVILLDCQMPEQDGYEVTRRIRETEKTSPGAMKSSPYIIALTANALYGDREKCLAAGMNDYLTKPLRLEDLEFALQRAFWKIAPTAPAKPAAHAVTLDQDIIAGLRDLRQPDHPDPLRELIDLFLSDARPRLQKIEQSIAAKDAPAVAHAAHAVKGSSSNLGARRLSALCATLEKTAAAGDLSEAANILLDIKSEFQMVEQALAAELEV
jgi:CheY-like chemotaxis protein